MFTRLYTLIYTLIFIVFTPCYYLWHLVILLYTLSYWVAHLLIYLLPSIADPACHNVHRQSVLLLISNELYCTFSPRHNVFQLVNTDQYFSLTVQSHNLPNLSRPDTSGNVAANMHS